MGLKALNHHKGEHVKERARRLRDMVEKLTNHTHLDTKVSIDDSSRQISHEEYLFGPSKRSWVENLFLEAIGKDFNMTESVLLELLRIDNKENRIMPITRDTPIPDDDDPNLLSRRKWNEQINLQQTKDQRVNNASSISPSKRTKPCGSSPVVKYTSQRSPHILKKSISPIKTSTLIYIRRNLFTQNHEISETKRADIQNLLFTNIDVSQDNLEEDHKEEHVLDNEEDIEEVTEEDHVVDHEKDHMEDIEEEHKVFQSALDKLSDEGKRERFLNFFH
ncbi:RIF1 [Mytilus edulis]|uniref:RIF1 n=1 Tax=Mytilus edulis TaxID=6550 RepID=A0A8S3VI62_MYTED|nr:RIF1 [Mytilus edulis]